MRASQSTRLRRAAAGWLLVVPCLLCTPARGPAQTSSTDDPAEQSEPVRLARSYVDSFIHRERLRTGSDFIAQEISRLQSALESGVRAEDLLTDFEQSDADTAQTLARLLEENLGPVARDLDGAAVELDRKVASLSDAWLSVRTALNQRQFLLFQVRGSRQVAGQLASLLSVDKRWFWLFGLIAVATLVGLVVHDRRHEFRLLLSGGPARKMGLSKFLTAAMVVLAALTLITFLLGDRIYEALLTVGLGDEASPRASIAEEQAAVDADIELLAETHHDLDHRLQLVQDEYRRKLTAAFPARSRIPSRLDQFSARSRQVAEAAALLKRIPQEMEMDQAELETVSRELASQAEATARYLRLRQWVRGGLGLALLGLAATGGIFYRRGIEARRRLTANTCPLCLGVDHLKLLPDYARSGVPGSVDVVQCKNVISEEPYEECDYTFMDVYRPLQKLCFPTLGVPQAGKTHWLTMLYWELNRGNYPRSIRFEKTRSQRSEEYDIIVEEILNSRIGTAATQRDRIPHPLVFNFQDRDRWGRSNMLVNIFDYSGEVTSDMGVDDYRRRRALEGDGFFFFLDPTYPSEPQAKALADFREDVRLVRGLRAGKRVRIPVALCIPKIDVLAGQSYALPDGGDAIARFYDDLGEIDPTGQSMTTRVIEARSRLTARLTDTVWPGWQIERQIHDLFGGRYLFFPLTPVGLDGRGETDLSLRTISPFGLLEPLVWLLEMNGYPVLDGS